MIPPYPEHAAERDRWILERRSTRNCLDPWRPYAFFVEEEASDSGAVVPVATVFLTNRECPWRCLMCDLWRNTLTETVPGGAIPEQIRFALSALPPAPQVKLYNAGSFFDPRAVPPEDFESIAGLVRPFERVIVECHPALVGEACVRFRDMLEGCLEVALGLETIHPEVMPRLNKRMTLDQFRCASNYLRTHEIDLRTFILVGLPFVDPEEAIDWTRRSLDFAFDCGATAASLIPTRTGNGAMEALEEWGEFVPPTLEMIEAATAYGLRLGRGRVFVDLWDLGRFERCRACFEARAERLRVMNLYQEVSPPIGCTWCGGNH